MDTRTKQVSDAVGYSDIAGARRSVSGDPIRFSALTTYARIMTTSHANKGDVELTDIPLTTIDGASTTLTEYEGKVLLIVNVASRCGLAPQYEKLEALQKKYADRGFTVLGFPSNQFLQELSGADAIKDYCSTTWGVTFPMFEKIRVNGRHQHPLYKQLTKVPDAEGKSGRITWNFEKFVITPAGEVHRFSPRTEPDVPEIIDLIESSLPST